MLKQRLFVVALLMVSLLITIVFIFLYFFRDPHLGEGLYDILHKNKAITQYADAKSLLSSYSKLSYSELPVEIKRRLPKNKGSDFYVIPENDFYRKICFNNRINSFLSREERIVGYHFRGQEKKYVYIDDQLLHTLFQLSDRLTALRYNASSIQIRSAHRSKSHNERVGGARNSQHLKGKALDLYVGDINGDRKINSADKKIVSDILDKEIIRSKGGIGFYRGTMVLHMDVRGKRARWNNYSR